MCPAWNKWGQVVCETSVVQLGVVCVSLIGAGESGIYTQDYWVFLTFPSSGILETRKHDVSETGCFRPQVKGGNKTPTQLGPLETAILNHWTISSFLGAQLSRCLIPPFYLRTGTDPVSEKSCFLVSRIPDDGKVQKNPVILCVIHHRQNPSESRNIHINRSIR
jgi:hypothetical protein